MNTKDFKNAVTALTKEKNISEDVIYEAMELALTSAYKKNYDSLSNVRVEFDKDTGDIKVFSFMTVVEDDYHIREEQDMKKFEKQQEDIKVLEEIEEETGEEQDKPELIKPFIFDERIHLTHKDALKQVPNIEIGETIEKEVTPKDFGRVAAATAKQVVIQKIREAEREVILSEFESKEDEMLSGLVAMEDERNYYIHLGKAQGILPKKEIIPNEIIKMGANIKVYVTKVENTTKGPLILLSRKHYGFVKRLFELEIPEINDGIVLIYSVAREAGFRTKVAVYSENPRVDAIGACIGEGGSRINNIIKELGGEKIDIVEYNDDSVKFIENALSPAKNLTVLLGSEESREATVIVSDDDLALAIGKGGQNVKLAARLTRYRLDIKNSSQAREMGINIIN